MMAVTVETLEKLERKMTLTLPVGAVQSEVETRLKKLARTVKMDGFRPGKVPMNVVAQRYGYSVHYEVMNDKVGEAFASAANEARLRVAGQPKITEKEGSPEGEMAFDAVFEVFPEVKFGDLSTADVEKLDAEVTDAAIDKTLDILRKQRRTFAQRAQDVAAQNGDRVTVDFEGKIDGEPFQGGKADDFQFILGDGQMLKEFEEATRGMKSGESKTFQLAFPADYHGKDVAGKTADFMVTVKKIEAANLPEVNEALAKSLGIAEATVEGLRADIKKNLEREVKFRLLARNKQAVMDALVSKAELDLPNASVQSELERLVEGARAELKQRGIKDAESAPIPRTCSALKQSAASVWVWWWPNWSRLTNCMPNQIRSRRILMNWPPAMRNHPKWFAGITEIPSAWLKLKASLLKTTSPTLCWARPRLPRSRFLSMS
jgi:trigger factor